MTDAVNQQKQHVTSRLDPNHKITKRSLNKLLATTLMALRTSLIDRWHLVVIQDSDQQQRIKTAARNQSLVTDASVLVILCTELTAWEENPHPYWRAPYIGSKESILPLSLGASNTLDPLQRDAIMRSCGIVAQTLIMTARSSSYAAYPVEGFDEDSVGEQIHLPDDHAICMMIAIGKGVEATPSEAVQTDVDAVFIQDHF